MTLLEFYDLLEKHDWHYVMSDDGKVYEKGRQAELAMQRVAASSPHHQALYDAWHAYVFSGKPWGTAKLQKPVRPA